MGTVALGDNGIYAGPFEAEAVPSNAPVVSWGMNGRGSIQHPAVVLQAEKAVGHTRRNEEDTAIVGRQFKCSGLTVGVGIFSQIQNHIQDTAGQAGHQFIMVMGWNLEVHPTEYVLVGYREKLLS